MSNLQKELGGAVEAWSFAISIILANMGAGLFSLVVFGLTLQALAFALLLKMAVTAVLLISFSNQRKGR